jgi:PKD repeat protein
LTRSTWFQKRLEKRTTRCGKPVTSLKPELLIELLEQRELLSVSLPLKLDFETPTSPVAPGYIGESVNGYSSSIGYGWANTSGLTAVNRNTSNPLTTDFVKGNYGTFLVDVANGTYDVTPILGDVAHNSGPMNIWLNGTLEAREISPAQGQVAEPTYTVTISDGEIQLHITGSHGGYFAIDGLTVAPHGTPFTANAGPAETGNEGSAITFAGSASGGQGTLSYQWNFGDGSTTAGTLTPSHTYTSDGTYAATLTVTDSLGDVSRSTAQVTVNNVAPTVSIGGPYSGTAGGAISFTGSGSVPDSGDTLSYSWNFGDNTTSTLQDPTHTYTTAGSYKVSLTVSDQEGASTTVTATATVTTDPPIASAGPNQTVNEGTAVTFAGTASGGVGSLTYQWTFGDGASTAGTLTPTHTYTSDGTYTATLTVTDSQGNVRASTTQVTVNNVAPTVSIGGPYSGSTTATINFSGSGSVPDTADTLSYSWNFGDGSTSTLQNPSHSYATPGTYTAKLTVADSENASTSATTTVTVTTPLPTGDYIVTPWDKIPNFGAHPTITSIHSGSWSNPNTWSLGRLPTDGDIVDISAGTTVTYDVSSSARINTVEVLAGSELDFATNVTTKLMVANFVVLQGATLTIGTAANPVAANVKAEVVFLNQPLNTTLDPQQYGDGLIGLGNVTIYGAAMPETFIRLAKEPRAGDTTLTLSQPATGWHVGDVITLPDTRQLDTQERGANYVSQIEMVTVAAISSDGLTLTLSSPLLYDHLGWHDANGVVQDLPHVADLSHNVIIHSESPTGVRGQVLFTYRATVNVENAAFVDLGRTTNAAFDNTTFASDGSVSHIGTNEGGRYSVQFLHLMGPATPSPNSYQYLFGGNAVY